MVASKNKQGIVDPTKDEGMGEADFRVTKSVGPAETGNENITMQPGTGPSPELAEGGELGLDADEQVRRIVDAMGYIDLEEGGDSGVIAVKQIESGRVIEAPGSISYIEKPRTSDYVLSIDPKDQKAAASFLAGYPDMTVMPIGTRDKKGRLYFVFQCEFDDVASAAVQGLRAKGIDAGVAKLEGPSTYIKLAGVEGQEIEVPVISPAKALVKVQQAQKADMAGVDGEMPRRFLGVDSKEVKNMSYASIEIPLDQFGEQDIRRFAQVIDLGGLIKGGKFTVTSSVRMVEGTLRSCLVIHGITEGVTSDIVNIASQLKKFMYGKEFFIYNSKPGPAEEGTIVSDVSLLQDKTLKDGEFLMQKSIAEQLKLDAKGHGREGQLVRKIKFRESQHKDWVIVEEVDLGLVIKGAETVGEDYKKTQEAYYRGVIEVAGLDDIKDYGNWIALGASAVLLIGHAGTGKSKHMLPYVIKRLKEDTAGPVRELAVSGREGFNETPFRTAIDLFNEIAPVYLEICEGGEVEFDQGIFQQINSYAQLPIGAQQAYLTSGQEQQRYKRRKGFGEMLNEMFRAIDQDSKINGGKTVLAIEDLHFVHDSTSGDVIARVIREVPKKFKNILVLPTTRPGKHLKRFVVNLVTNDQLPEIHTPTLDFIDKEGKLDRAMLADIVHVTLKETGADIEYASIDVDSFRPFAEICSGIPFVMKALIENAYNANAITVQNGRVILDEKYGKRQRHEIGQYDPENDSSNARAIAKILANKFEGTIYQNTYKLPLLACIGMLGTVSSSQLYELVDKVVVEEFDGELVGGILNPYKNKSIRIAHANPEGALEAKLAEEREEVVKYLLKEVKDRMARSEVDEDAIYRAVSEVAPHLSEEERVAAVEQAVAKEVGERREYAEPNIDQIFEVIRRLATGFSVDRIRFYLNPDNDPNITLAHDDIENASAADLAEEQKAVVEKLIIMITDDPRFRRLRPKDIVYVLESVVTGVNGNLVRSMINPKGDPKVVVAHDDPERAMEEILDKEKKDVVACMVKEMSVLDMVEYSSTGFRVANPMWVSGIINSMPPDKRLELARGVMQFCIDKKIELPTELLEQMLRVIVENVDSLESLTQQEAKQFSNGAVSRMRIATTNFDFKTQYNEAIAILENQGPFAEYIRELLSPTVSQVDKLEGLPAKDEDAEVSDPRPYLKEPVKNAVIAGINGCAHMRKWDQGLEIIKKFKPAIERAYQSSDMDGLGSIAIAFAKAEQTFWYFYDQDRGEEYLKTLSAATQRLRDLRVGTSASEVIEARRYRDHVLPPTSRYRGISGNDAITKLKEDLQREARTLPREKAGIGPGGNPEVNEAIRIITSRNSYAARDRIMMREDGNGYQVDPAEVYAYTVNSEASAGRIRVLEGFLKMVAEGDKAISPIVEEDLNRDLMINLALAGRYEEALEIGEVELFNRAFIKNNFGKLVQAACELAPIAYGQVAKQAIANPQLKFEDVNQKLGKVRKLLHDVKNALSEESPYHEYINGQLIQGYAFSLNMSPEDIEALEPEEKKKLAEQVEVVLMAYLDSFRRGYLEDDENLYDMLGVAIQARRIGMLFVTGQIKAKGIPNLTELCALSSQTEPFSNIRESQMRISEFAKSIKYAGPVKAMKLSGVGL